MKNPIVSIIIPTYYKSKDLLEIPLKSISEQNCSKIYYETIIADNKGGEPVRQLAKKYGAKIIDVDGNPPQSCRQVNLGAKISNGEYLLLLDHDIELASNLIENFIEILKVKKNKKVDAWILPYKIIARGKLLTAVRNFEEAFYKNSLIATARIIKHELFWKTENRYDVTLTNGPADWDFTIQLKLSGAKFAYIKDYVYHHEEGMTLWHLLTKKSIYAKGGEIYQKKWEKKNKKIYNDIVRKQFSPFYRLVWIFIEDGKWKRLFPNLHLYLLFLLLKVTTALIYFIKLQKTKL